MFNNETNTCYDTYNGTNAWTNTGTGMGPNSNTFYNVNSNNYYNQILTMTIIPLFTTLFTSIFGSLTYDIKTLIVGFGIWIWNKLYPKKCVEIRMYTQPNNKILNEYVIPIIWYLNKTKSIDHGTLINISKVCKSEQILSEILMVPSTGNFELGTNTSSGTGSGTGSNTGTGTNANMWFNSNASIYALFTREYFPINTTQFYWKIIFDKLIIISYKHDIEAIGDFITNVTDEYIKYKRDLDKNKVVEKKVYIEMYKRMNIAYFRGENQLFNTNIIPILWYLNKKNVITSGCVYSNDDDKNENGGIFGRSFDPNHQTEKPNGEKYVEKYMVPLMDCNFIEKTDSISNNEVTTHLSGSKTNAGTEPATPIANTKISPNELTNVKHELEPDLYCYFTHENNPLLSLNHGDTLSNRQFIVFCSTKYSTEEIHDFLERVETDYKMFISNKLKKQYLYFFNPTGTNKFTKLLLDKSQSFEHLFFAQKKSILKDLELFENVKFHEKYGMKRKLSYLFYGPPGCGKSAIVTAIANHLGRSLKNIPISEIKTNQDINEIFSDIDCGVGQQVLTSRDIVINFDEIDSLENLDALKKKSSEIKNNENEKVCVDDTKENNLESNQKQETTTIINIYDGSKTGSNQSSIATATATNTQTSKNNFNIGVLLSKLDGNECQDGNIIIATCNNIENLDPSIYRNGRLKLIKLTYAGRQEICEMIEKYCEIKLGRHEREFIRDDRTIQTLNIKNVITSYLKEIEFDTTRVDVLQIIYRIGLLSENDNVENIGNVHVHKCLNESSTETKIDVSTRPKAESERKTVMSEWTSSKVRPF